LASLALIVGISSTNAACVWFFHQPKVPNGMRAYKKHQ
jgi:cyclic lactone autoinducer peptide